MADEFAVYKGETFLDEGSAEELAERFNVKPDKFDGGLLRLVINEIKENER